jgi:Flp pilus assembly protein TadD
MTRTQWAVLGACLFLFGIIYFGFDTKAPDRALVERSRGLLAEEVGALDPLFERAREVLDGGQQAQITDLEAQLAAQTTDSGRVATFEALSRSYFEFGQYALAGHYARELAEIANTEEAWSIAGTTFGYCVQQSQEEATRNFCTQGATESLQNAISLAPEEVSHRVNLALVLTNNPPPDNPMRGILMLRELQEENPENVLVLTSLARLALQTGQVERAIQRLEQALAIDATDRNANCLAASAYRAAGREAEATRYTERCEMAANN